MSGNPQKAVTIVIANYNGRALLEKYLPHAVAAADYYSFDTEIIVVDDASIDDSVAYLEKHHPSVRVIRHAVNLGFGRASDTGIRAARNPVVILLNTDVCVREDFIAPLVSHFAADDVFAVMAMSLREDGHTPGELVKVPFFKRGYLKFVSSENADLQKVVSENDGFPSYSFYAVGGHCALDRAKYFELKGFDELYYPFYFEDVDLCYRGWKRGWKTIFEPRSIVYHYHDSGSIRSKHREAYIGNIIRRNRLLFVWKNITSPRYFCLNHLLPVLFRSIAGIFVLDVSFLRALFGALRRLPLALKRRKEEKLQERILSDEEIFKLILSGSKSFKKELLHEVGASASILDQ
ncbi:MAG: glycosyltransferase [Candidatus Abyssobacteria bacterium SURF_5]|uniref:Glycosyltransferase n=1 Tax=Abyssobacteria bacterium (strain SURF_5) TaxID=2093360 RepID=A0A3A4NVK4_ABYX5|nr:MAG: glycosyltransferase [Candidatus Abyssubacteria bacterium SURF_5]